jgi:hypothetical protein
MDISLLMATGKKAITISFWMRTSPAGNPDLN